MQLPRFSSKKKNRLPVREVMRTDGNGVGGTVTSTYHLLLHLCSICETFTFQTLITLQF